MDLELKNALHERGADIVLFVDISALPAIQTQGYPKAVLFCMLLSKKFVRDMRNNIQTDHDEFEEKERLTDALADWLASYIRQKGYRAYSQSEKSHIEHGNYDEKTLSSILPHKTVAGIAGLGFMGKNNLLVTPDYGSAFSMCSVLTDAPVTTENQPIIPPKCGSCEICKNVCPTQAIHGNKWTPDGGRAALVDVYKCDCALKCMVHCPWTVRYAGQTD